MPPSVDEIELTDLQYIEGMPTVAEWNANPELFRQKYNEMVDEVNRMNRAIKTGYTGSTTKGLVYYVTAAGALALLTPDTENIDSLIFGFGTGNTGEIQQGDIMEKTDIAPAAGKMWLGPNGTVLSAPDRTAGKWIVPLGIAESTGKAHIHINPNDVRRMTTLAEMGI